MEAGHEASHWSSLGPGNAPDEFVLRKCRLEDAVLLTHDLDFGAILAFSGDRAPSVIQIRGQEVDPAAIGEALKLAITQFGAQLAEGALLTVDPRRAKVRLLPIR